MARRARLLLLLAVVAALAVAAAPVHASSGDGGDESGVGGMRRWLDDLNATDTATATNLTTTGFISYDALFADIVPCSVPGASYYNCRPGAEANPYERGCSAITQCRD